MCVCLCVCWGWGVVHFPDEAKNSRGSSYAVSGCRRRHPPLTPLPHFRLDGQKSPLNLKKHILGKEMRIANGVSGTKEFSPDQHKLALLFYLPREGISLLRTLLSLLPHPSSLAGSNPPECMPVHSCWSHMSILGTPSAGTGSRKQQPEIKDPVSLYPLRRSDHNSVDNLIF